MSASDHATGCVGKSARFGILSVLLLAAVAARCPQAVAKEDLPLEELQDPIMPIAYSTSGDLVATARERGGVKVTDVVTGKVVITLGKESVEAMAFSPDGKLLLTHDGSRIELWGLDRSEGQAVSKGFLPEPSGEVAALAFSPDGKTLAIGSLGVNLFNSYGAVSLWDVASRKRLRSLKGPMDGVYSLAFSPDGKVLAVGTGQGSAHGSGLHRPKGTVQLWDVNTGRLQTTLKTAHDISWVEAVAFSPDGKTLASAASRIEGNLVHDGWQLVWGVELWDVATGKERAFLKGQQGNVNSLVFSADGSMLATADVEVRLWDSATGTHRATLKEAFTPLTFSKDGNRLATLLLDGKVKWIDIEKLPKATPGK